MKKMLISGIIIAGILEGWGCGKSEQEQESNAAKQSTDTKNETERQKTGLLLQLLKNIDAEDATKIMLTKVNKDTWGILERLLQEKMGFTHDIFNEYDGFVISAMSAKSGESNFSFDYLSYYLNVDFDEFVKKVTEQREIIYNFPVPRPPGEKEETKIEKRIGEYIFEVEKIEKGVLFTTKKSLKKSKKYGDDKSALQGFFVKKMGKGCFLYLLYNGNPVYTDILTKGVVSNPKCLNDNAIKNIIRDITLDNLGILQIKSGEENSNNIIGSVLLLMMQSNSDSLIELTSWIIYDNPLPDNIVQIYKDNIDDFLIEKRREVDLLDLKMIDNVLKTQIKVTGKIPWAEIEYSIKRECEIAIKVANQGFVVSKENAEEKVAISFLTALKNKDKSTLVTLARGKALEWINREFDDKIAKKEISEFILRIGQPDCSRTPPPFEFYGTIIEQENGQNIRKRFKMTFGKEEEHIIVSDFKFQ